LPLFKNKLKVGVMSRFIPLRIETLGYRSVGLMAGSNPALAMVLTCPISCPRDPYSGARNKSAE